MRCRGPLGVVMVLLALLFVASIVSSEGSSLFRLNNERDVPVTVFDIKNASSEELSKAEHRLGTTSWPIYSDVDTDGFPEIYYISYEGQFIQYRMEDDTYHVLLEDENASFALTPQIIDVDLDNSMEVLLFDGATGSVRCFDMTTGEEEWSFSNPSEDDWPPAMPKVWTDEGSNESRVLVILHPGTLVMLDGQGNELWRHRIENVYNPIFNHNRPTMGIADLDLDGDMEVVVYSTKSNGDGLSFPDLDVFSLEPPRWLSNHSIPGNATTGSMASSSPLLVDILQLMDGLEIVVGTMRGGLAVVSSEDGTVVWQDTYDDVWEWNSLGLVRTENGTFLLASSWKGIYVLKTHSGEIVHFHQMGVNTLYDHPLVAYCEPGSASQALIHGAGKVIRATRAMGNESIWSDIYEKWPGRFRYLLIRGRSGVSVELHVFFSHTRYGDYEDEVLHYRYWIPEAEDREIIVDPSYYTWFPNVSLFTRGILIDGAPKDIRWVMVRLYQGEATDQFVMNRWPNPYRKMESWGTYRLRVNRSSFGTDGIDDEHSWVAMGIIAPWYYAQFGYIHLHVTVYYTDGKAVSVDVKDWLRCEYGLVTGGTLELVDGDGNVYHDKEWVRAGTNTTLRGVHLSFPDGLHVPDPGDVQLVLTVGGTTYPAALGLDGAITAKLRLPDGLTTDLDITLEISNRWTGFRSNHTMMVRLDADPPSFLSFYPENGIWLANIHVFTGCRVTDGEGSGVGEIQVQYWISGWSRSGWEDVDTASRPFGKEAVNLIHIDEGTWFVQWRAWDMVGHGPVTSPHQTINVDLTSVIFRNFAPEGWINSTPVEVSITIEDVSGSGVDLATIEYTYSTAGLFNFTNWASVDLSGIQEEVKVTLNIPFKEGIENVVVVRAADIVGNSRSSSAYFVLIDLTPPVFLDPVPDERDIITNTTNIVCSIYVDDTYSGVEIVEFHFSTDEGSWSDWTAADPKDEEGPLWEATIQRNDGGPTSVQWRASDRAASGVTYSDVFVLNMNRPPDIVELVPASQTEVREDEKVTFSVKYIDPEGDDVIILWWLDGKEVSDSDVFTTGLSEGEHEIRLVLDDGQGNVVEATIEVSSVERTVLTGEEGWPYLLIIIVALIAVAVIVYALRMRDPL